MIKANELRVGNLYIHGSTIDDFKVYQIAKDLEDWHPLPLTTGWLERCGFESSGRPPFIAYRRNVNSVDELCWYMQDGFMRYQTQGSGFTRQMGHIKSVHQLQNWWYSFTGEELQIKLP